MDELQALEKAPLVVLDLLLAGVSGPESTLSIAGDLPTSRGSTCPLQPGWLEGSSTELAVCLPLQKLSSTGPASS